MGQLLFVWVTKATELMHRVLDLALCRERAYQGQAIQEKPTVCLGLFDRCAPCCCADPAISTSGAAQAWFWKLLQSTQGFFKLTRNLQGGAGLLARDGAVRQALAPSASDGLLAGASLWKALLRAPMASPTTLNLVSLLINTESSM